MGRTPELQGFLDCTEAAIRTASVAGSRFREALPMIFGRLRETPGSAGTAAAQRLPVCDWLTPALAIADASAPEVRAVAASLRAIAPALAWRRRVSAKPGDEPFYSGHANASAIGPGGLEERGDVHVGISLMAPHIRYPDHSHPPEEVYLSLAGGKWRNAAEDWTAPGSGGLFHNPPGIVHAMEAGGEPLLAIWCLWS